MTFLAAPWLAPAMRRALAACAIVCTAAFAQGVSESAVKAAFLLKFASFVEWPAGALRPGQPLVIGVSGAAEVADNLEQLAGGKTVDGHPVVVKRLAADAPAPAGLHIFFVGTRREARLREAVASPEGPVLIVAEQPGALQAGAAINFMPESGRVRFGAAPAAAAAHGIRLSARLLAVALPPEATP